MSFIWLVLWLDEGLPQLHDSAWLFGLIAAIGFDILFKLAWED